MGVSGTRRTVGTVAVRSTVAGVTAALLLVFGAACGSDNPAPAPLEDDPGSGTVAGKTPDDGPSPTPTEDDNADESTPTPLDVCALVGAERVQELFELAAPPAVERPDPDELGGAIPGVEAISYCTYRWGKGQTSDQVRVTVMSEIEIADPQEFVDSASGDESKPLDGAGDAATVDRSERFGHGLGSVAAAKQTDAGVVAVTILAPIDSKAESFSGLANEFFENASAF